MAKGKWLNAEPNSVNKMIRLSPRVRELLAQLAAQSGENESAVVRRLIENASVADAAKYTEFEFSAQDLLELIGASPRAFRAWLSRHK